MFVILGATGKVGRTTIRELRAQGAPVRAVVRKSSDVEDLSALGCEIAVADLDETAALKSAIAGAETVQVICPVRAQAADAVAEMAKTIDAMSNALKDVRPAKVLAISDYGAHLSEGTGIAAELLTDATRVAGPRIVHAEGPRRYDAIEVAATLSKIVGREIIAREIPQSDWIPALTRVGISPSYARLVFELYVAHNAGRIDVEPGATDIRFGTTELRAVFASLSLQTC